MKKLERQISEVDFLGEIQMNRDAINSIIEQLQSFELTKDDLYYLSVLVEMNNSDNRANDLKNKLKTMIKIKVAFGEK